MSERSIKNIYDAVDYEELAQLRRAMRIRLEEVEAQLKAHPSEWGTHFCEAVREAFLI